MAAETLRSVGLDRFLRAIGRDEPNPVPTDEQQGASCGKESQGREGSTRSSGRLPARLEQHESGERGGRNESPPGPGHQPGQLIEQATAVGSHPHRAGQPRGEQEEADAARQRQEKADALAREREEERLRQEWRKMGGRE